MSERDWIAELAESLQLQRGAVMSHDEFMKQYNFLKSARDQGLTTHERSLMEKVKGWLRSP